jgi:intracellular septation protein
MKQLLDFLPILLFFGAYKLYGIYVATAVLMAATVVHTLYIYKTEGRLLTMQKVTLWLVLGFGALTLLLQDERFIKIKPTILYGALAIALAVGLWGFGKNLLRSMLGGVLELPTEVWRNLTIAWIGYSIFMASINAYVAYFWTTEQWINFKLWGYAFPIMFLIAQGFYIAKHLPKDEESGG